MSSSFVIVHQKAQKEEEVFVYDREALEAKKKNIPALKQVLWIWLTEMGN